MKIKYQNRRFSAKSLELIEQVNQIISNFRAQGFDLTLRQIYYRLVASDKIPNTVQAYKKVGAAVVHGRMAGLIDWNAIVDRTRQVRELTHWRSPSSIVDAAVHSFRIDRWARQPIMPEVWIEKDALVGVFLRSCRELDVPLFSCRGYVSLSEMWRAGRRRMQNYKARGQRPVIYHFGDHDPSGIDMTRDIRERLSLFAESSIEVARVALSLEQVLQYEAPPNPAKLSDPRAGWYLQEYGRESWELDALDPTVLAQLTEDQVKMVRDEDLWSEAIEEEEKGTEMLRKAAEQLKEGWDE